MKLAILIGFIFISSISSKFYSPPRHDNGTCNVGLLASYDLEWVKEPVKTKNYLCNGIENNCCTANSQKHIYNSWITGNIKKKLLHVYKTFLATFSLIFDDFKVIEQMAEIVLSQKSPDEDTNCGDLAEEIMHIKASSLKEAVLTAAQKAYRFIYDSRRGFYCSLCDADAHENYNTQDGSTHFSYGFCSDLVEETMAWSVFQYQHFHKFARLYGHFLSACDTMGIYEETDVLNDHLKFYKDEKIDEKIDKCTKNMEEDSSINNCYEYCEEFNPAKFSELFEGQFTDLLAFREWMSQEVNSKILASMISFTKDDLGFSGRLLSEKDQKHGQNSLGSNENRNNQTNQTQPEKSKKGLWNTKQSNINHFNEKYVTQIIEPITYDPTEDFSHAQLFNYEDSIFKLGNHKIYDIAHFRGVLSTNGTNFLKYGYQLDMNPKNLKKLDKLLKKEASDLLKNSKDVMSPNYGYNTKKRIFNN